MTSGVHPSVVRKRERVSWASPWITGRQLVIAPRPSKDLSREKEDSRMGWKHRQRENELDVLSHLISEEKPSASHMCARISSHTYDRQK
jgi:hypothetical protein